ncbi:MAG: 5'-methylthioadenosine/adenosylhomocysteine nucleosidase [Spirochaetia bacterium]
MSILVLTAMEIEKQGLLSAMHDVKTTTLINGTQLFQGVLDGQEFSLIEAGIGKVNAAMTCALALQAHSQKVSLLINSGVAGALAALTPCDIVISESLAYYDVNVCAFGYQLGQVPGQPSQYKAQAKFIDSAKSICQRNNIPVHIGQIVTGDEFVQDDKKVKMIKTAFPQALALEMEGAAVAQVAYRCDVPFLVIRAISDASDGGAKDSYEHFLTKAASQSQLIVRGLLNA